MDTMKNNFLDFFSGLSFQSDIHKYFVKGVPINRSVSALIKDHCSPFNSHALSIGVAKKRGITQAEVLAEWKQTADEAIQKGNQAHLFGELYPFNRGLRPQSQYDIAIMKFWSDLPEYIIPVTMELQMYHIEKMYAGTADIILYNTKTNRYIIGDYKGLPIDTKILTTKGWSTMGQVKIGDKVFDKKGEVCNIKNTSEIKNKKCYKIIFDNGEEIVSDFEHRWEISFVNSGVKKDIVMTTEEIKKEYDKGVKSSYKQMRIYNPKPLHTKTKDLPIDPYVLGVWLGDGHSVDNKITQQNIKVWEEIEKRGYTVGDDISQGGSGKATTRTVFGLRNKLKTLNLLGNKHIPIEYILSSKEQRIDLLRGFMDADGYYNKSRKRYIMATTRKSQVDFFIPLLGSLGIKPTIIKAKKYCSNKVFEGYDVCFTTLINPFLNRNQDIDLKTNDIHNYRRIKSVIETNTVPTRCIEVDSDTHTFLYGESFIVTHNTNKDLFKNFKGQKLTGRFNHLLDTPLNKYQIQLSYYQILLEQTEVEVSHRKVIWLLPDGTYKIYECEDLTQYLK